jgi:molybdopterin-guanine dinucleotide biosynthesis protein MobB
MIRYPVPLLGICAWSGTGKTTLLARLLPILQENGLRVAVVKHAHHSFELDQPGKDSWTLRKAGAEQMLVASRKRAALITDFADDSDEPALADLLPMLDSTHLDMVLVEGFKREVIPKIELHRPQLGRPLLCGRMRHIIAVASDAPLKLPRPLKLLDLNNADEIARFIIDFRQQGQRDVC